MIAHAMRRGRSRVGGSRGSRGLAPGASGARKLAAATFPDSPVCTSQRVLMTKATGIIGRIAASRLIERGHVVMVSCRDRAKPLDLFGPHAQLITALDTLRANERIDTVITLAGQISRSPGAGA